VIPAASLAWAAGGVSVGVVHVRALHAQPTSHAARPIVFVVRLVLVSAFAALAVHARALAALLGWVVGYAFALSFFSRLRGAA
jgi:hypothetical protein